MNEIKLKSWKPVIIFICIVAPIVLFCFLMILSGRVTVNLKGYARYSIPIMLSQSKTDRRSFFRQTIIRIILICKATKPEKRKTHKHIAQYAESIISSRKKAMYI